MYYLMHFLQKKMTSTRLHSSLTVLALLIFTLAPQASAGLAQDEAAIFEVMFSMPMMVQQMPGGSGSKIWQEKQRMKKIKEENMQEYESVQQEFSKYIHEYKKQLNEFRK